MLSMRSISQTLQDSQPPFYHTAHPQARVLSRIGCTGDAFPDSLLRQQGGLRQGHLHGESRLRQNASPLPAVFAAAGAENQRISVTSAVSVVHLLRVYVV